MSSLMAAALARNKRRRSNGTDCRTGLAAMIVASAARSMSSKEDVCEAAANVRQSVPCDGEWRLIRTCDVAWQCGSVREWRECHLI